MTPTPAWGHRQGLLDLGPLTLVEDAREQVVDRLLIQETLSRYAWAYDERRLDILRDVFTEDAVFIGKIGGQEDFGPFEGREAIVSWLADYMESQLEQRRHNVGNVVIDQLAGERAQATAYLILTAIADGNPRIVATGWYQAHLVRQGSKWRLRHVYLGADVSF